MSGKRRRPTAIDLFAGAGGLALGFEQAGFDIVAAVEYDPIHSAIHKLNFPDATIICDDVRNLSELPAEQLRERLGIEGELDAVVGGPPCQGFSLIGHRVLEDPRNELVFHFFKIVETLRPRLFVMENVPGMATGKHHGLLDELVSRFKGIGYRVREPVRVLNAAEYGVPQNRRRLFVIGAREGVRMPAYPSATHSPSHLSQNGKGKHVPAVLPATPNVADAICDLPDVEQFDRLFHTDELPIRLNGGSLYAQRLRGDVEDPSDFSYQRIHDRACLTGCLRARHTELSRLRFGQTAPGTTEPISRFYRLSLEGLSNTLRAGTASERGAFTAPRPIHPVHPRCITVREAARLHSFPDWFRFHRTIWHGFRQIGNAVPPILGRAVGASFIEALGETPSRPTHAVAMGPTELSAYDMSAAANHFGVHRHVIPPRQRKADAKTPVKQLPLAAHTSEAGAE